MPRQKEKAAASPSVQPGRAEARDRSSRPKSPTAPTVLPQATGAAQRPDADEAVEGQGRAPAPDSSVVKLDVSLILGGLSNVKAPVAIGARYEGLAPAGPTKVFDRLLDSWLTRAVDLGIIGSGLG